jgi:glycosyltransferase involved in cell wall biosynthesis
MVPSGSCPNQPPLFSIIIAVYNDWDSLVGCLRSFAQQKNGSPFEVIVVDDGSTREAPEFLRVASDSLTIRVIRQSHAGVSAARNLGIRNSQGAVLLFVDADCRPQENCLATLSSVIARFPSHNSFQLRLIGNCASLMGRAEELRLAAFQRFMLQADGRIRYLSTAGFAIRRSVVDVEKGLFDIGAQRGEDTLLLANLTRFGELPLFVPDAVVEHYIDLSWLECARKDVRSSSEQAPAYRTIELGGVRIFLSHRDRVRLLWLMWKTARQQTIGRSAWFALVMRQAFKRLLSFRYKVLPPWSVRKQGLRNASPGASSALSPTKKE